MNRCRKQHVRCDILTPDGAVYTGYNSCSVEGAECPRVEAGCASGEGYELCGPQRHAEVDAALRSRGPIAGGVAFITGHTYACNACQEFLAECGVTDIQIVRTDVQRGVLQDMRQKWRM